MDNCLFCYKEINLQNTPSNPSQLICKTLGNLFSSLNNSAELFYVKNETKLNDSRLCPACFKCIDQVQDTFKELEALQVKIEGFRQKIQNELIEGYKKSTAASKGQRQLQLSESFQLRKSIVQIIATSVLDEHDVLTTTTDYGEENDTAEDFNNFHDFDYDLPILSPHSAFDDLNLNEIKPTFGSFWNLKPLQIVLTRCDEENNTVKVNAKSSNLSLKKKPHKTPTSTSKKLLSNSDYKCESCNKYITTRRNYKRHMLNQHDVDINLQIEVDLKTTDDLVILDSETDDDLPDDDTHMSYKTFRNFFLPDIAKCPKCDKRFLHSAQPERKRKLARHLRTVHSMQIKLKNEKPLKMGTTSVAKYAKYYKIEKVNGVDQVKCPLCSNVFEGKGLSCRLTRHLDSVHKPNSSTLSKMNVKRRREPRGEFTCRKCKVKFSTRSYLERHECFPERLTLLKSSIPAAQINENTTLLPSGVPDKIQCDQCGKLFTGNGCKARIKYHLLRIHNIDVRPQRTPIKKEKGPFFCTYPGCSSASFGIRSMGHLRRHIKTIHGELLQLDHQCDRCAESFEAPNLLRSHQVRVHESKPEVQNSFICDVCAQVFDKKSSLQVHQTAMHQLKYACHVPNCNKIYTQKLNFEYHLRSYHGIGEKLKYQCKHENCNYSSNRRANFEIHVSKHTELRAFKCELCNVSVKTKRGLGLHMFTRHTHPESAKRQCPECELSFLHKRELDNHLIVRHGIGEKIKCTYCPREFAIRRYMRNHVRKDHANEDKTKNELMKRWVPLEMLEAPLEVQKELITSITASEQGRKENEQKNS